MTPSVWPLDIDLDLTHIEVIIQEWLKIISEEGGQPRTDPKMVLDGCRMLAYQVAAIKMAELPNYERVGLSRARRRRL